MSVIETEVREVTPSEVRIVDPRVEEAARALDRIKPGWADKINLNRFNVAHPSNCVLGQVYKKRFFDVGMPFTRGLEDLRKHGYMGPNPFFDPRDNADWRLEIQARKTR